MFDNIAQALEVEVAAAAAAAVVNDVYF